MLYLKFGWIEDDANSLASELQKPFDRVSIHTEPHHLRPIAITLWRSDLSGLRLESKMHDIAERRELGILQFRRVDRPLESEHFISPPLGFRNAVSAAKLLLKESFFKAECGILLRSDARDEISISPGAYPYSLAIRGLTDAPHIFEPEFPLTDYQQVRFG